MIKISRNKAENIARDRLRAEREAVLEELDIKAMRALELGEDMGAIASTKQTLRDVTAKDLAKLSIEQLAALDLEQALRLP